MVRRLVHTKILATLGPACASEEQIAKLIGAGADAFRLNFSHGDPAKIEPLLKAARSAAAHAGAHVALVGDLCGPKVRIGALHASDEGRVYQAGDELTLVRGLMAGEPGRVGTNETRVVDEAQVGHRVLIDDGALRFVVTEKRVGEVACRCTVGGVLQSRKGVNLPDTMLSLAALTSADREWVRWSAANGLDFLALSFVRSAGDVEELRGLLRELGCTAGVIAKVEHPAAVDAMDGIIEASDAVMVARGDLGVEMDVARVPVIQKEILRRCSAAQKPVIVATQMLQSMIESARPTRAEVSDVANAIHDGADAVMLSGETAVGKHPVAAVEMMNHVAEVTEQDLFRTQGELAAPAARAGGDAQEMALAQGACRMARALGAEAIVTVARGGGMARLFAKLRPAIPVVALGENEAVLRRAALLFGVVAHSCAVPEQIEHLLPRLDAVLTEKLGLKAGSAVVVVGGLGAGRPRRPNTVMIHRVGEREATRVSP